MSDAHTADAWHFVYDEKDCLWSWRRLSRTTGEECERSAYSFASYNVCIADAERAGFIPKPANMRLRASEFEAWHGAAEAAQLVSDRRRRPRTTSGS